MPGMFDDLIPENTQKPGMFDDLVPTQDQPQTEGGKNLYQRFQDWQKRTGRRLFGTDGEIGAIDKAIASNLVGRTAAEAGAGIGRTLSGAFDAIATDPINEVIRMTGGEDQFFSGVENYLNQTANMDKPFMKTEGLEGVARKYVVKPASEAAPMALGGGAVARQVAQRLPQATAMATQTVGQGVLRQLGSTTAAQDVALGGLSGSGGEIGEEIGGEPGRLVGAILLPASAEGSKNALRGIFRAGRRGWQALTRSLSELSDDEASRLLAEAMVRENLSPDDVTRELARLGDDAIPADVGNNFARLLRTASNKIPQIQGRASSVLNQRQQGAGARIARATDELIAGNVDDAITKLNRVRGPKAKELYDRAFAKGIQVSPRLKSLLEGDTSLGRSRQATKQAMIDMRALGENPSTINLIDETKKVMDDKILSSIKSGATNRARRLVLLKNEMMKEADKSIPEYKQARDLFAGTRQLEQAASFGEEYLKLKPREVRDLVRTMGKSEKEMFKLGAKRAMEDKILDTNTNADQVRRLFGKNGDVQKLRTLFDDRESFNRFSNALEREANFTLTRRAAQGNSSTAQQISDMMTAQQGADDARAILMGGNAEKIGAVTRILGKLSGSKRDEAFTRGLEEAGDILIEANVNPSRVQRMLRSGSRRMIEKELRRALNIPQRTTIAAPLASAIAAQENNQ